MSESSAKHDAQQRADRIRAFREELAELESQHERKIISEVEYIQRKAAVRKYGISTMDALNRGIIPTSVFQSYSAAPSIAGARAEAGGSVVVRDGSGGNSATIVNYFDQTAFKQFLNSEEGKRAMVNHVSENSFKYKKILAVA